MNTSILIDISQLRIGMYIQLDVGWLHHPFPVSSFRVSSAEQIATLRALGLQQVRYFPNKSDPGVDASVTAVESAVTEVPSEASAAVPAESAAEAEMRRRKRELEEQHRVLASCNRRFGEATRKYIELGSLVYDDPGDAKRQTEALVAQCAAEMLSNGESVIRLLSEGAGERSAQHPVNVMVLSMLLAKALGLQGEELQSLGVAALLHDLGKLKLPDGFRESLPSLTPNDRLRYQTHVAESVAFASRMGLSPAVLTAIAHHHEMADGSGFPQRLAAPQLPRSSQILSLVNRYDRMCNPLPGVDALTPHEVLSVLFAQHKSKFDSVVLGAFIRMMGVYPPGSVVQLVNDRYAIVVSVNSSRPLRPRVVVHDAQIPKEEALILDLETVPELGIRRSLKPAQLPREALDYLSPRKRICYFFERAVSPASSGAAP
ncbi:MAG: HD-GYP domain-containing protein [Burkholderiaceae bacterium]